MKIVLQRRRIEIEVTKRDREKKREGGEKREKWLER